MSDERKDPTSMDSRVHLSMPGGDGDGCAPTSKSLAHIKKRLQAGEYDTLQAARDAAATLLGLRAY